MNIRYHDHIEAMNTVGWFLGNNGITNDLITGSAEENGLIGLGYFLPDGSYYQWRKCGNYGITNDVDNLYPGGRFDDWIAQHQQRWL